LISVKGRREETRKEAGEEVEEGGEHEVDSERGGAEEKGDWKLKGGGIVGLREWD
jgi:hypothetical protein